MTPSVRDDISSSNKSSSQHQVEVEDVDVASPTKAVQEGTLKIAEQDLKRISTKVLEVHRRNSYRHWKTAKEYKMMQIWFYLL